MLIHTGAVESRLRAVESHPGALEAHPRAIQCANIRAKWSRLRTEDYHKAVKALPKEDCGSKNLGNSRESSIIQRKTWTPPAAANAAVHRYIGIK